jgi:hypothetical protein
MSKIYKFMHSKDVGSLLSGRLLFRDYRAFHQGEYPIADAGEGNFAQVAMNYWSKPEDGTNPFGPGITVPAGCVLRMDDIVVVNEVSTTLISSFSTGEFDELCGSMIGKGPEKYDAAVEIVDASMLIHAITNTGMFIETGQRCSITHRPSGDRIQYVDIQTPDANGHLSHLIFRKRPAYSHQKEYRIIMPGITGALPHNHSTDPVFVQIPESRWSWMFRQVL